VLEEILHRQGNILVRRLRLESGEATRWHRDPYERLTVTVQGEALAIEYRDGAAPDSIEVTPGQTGWDGPSERPHRAVNVGRQAYEEVVVFFLDRAGADAQPDA
jgi:hypothetical protein